MEILEKLVQKEYLTSEQVSLLREKQKETNNSISELLIDTGIMSEDDSLRIFSEIYNMPVVDLERIKTDKDIFDYVPKKIALAHKVIPICRQDGKVVVAMSDPFNILALDDMRYFLKSQIFGVLSKRKDIERCIEKYYDAYSSPSEIISSEAKDNTNEMITESERDSAGGQEFYIRDEKEHRSMVSKLVNSILKHAVKSRASDIHIEPQERGSIVRYRVDGDLQNVTKFSSTIHSSVVVRLKILTKLNIAESQKPQDGRVRVNINQRKVDMRISVFPTFYGEKIVIRLLDPREAKCYIDKLGLNDSEARTLLNAIASPQGMVLVTGPTGSGKTSTLYAAINYLKKETNNIVTIEDPVEYLIDGINQTQTNPTKNLTFANGLRSILRQDPNIILVGEIRDKETADIAMRSSFTGHLVLSSLHSNSAVASITRLNDIGIKPYMIVSSMRLIIAQRLVKIICPYCKERYNPEPRLLDLYANYIEKFNVTEFYRGAGCEQCNFTGYAGRTAIFEMLKFTDPIKNLINHNAYENEILEEAMRQGLRPLIESGIAKIAEGITTLDELTKIDHEYETHESDREKTYDKFVDISKLVKESESNGNNGNTVVDAAERRRNRRIEKSFITRFKINGENDENGHSKITMISLRNLSAGGALFRNNCGIEKNKMLDMKINLPGYRVPISCLGKVIRTEREESSSMHEIGIMFMNIKQEERDSINKLVDYYFSKKASRHEQA
ncbi:MAG: Flp pilus assembly complex ATPase component TadA [Candidatus Omnitrophica bacterium]|nr:Flp pilus assembly complex ATPase component TadA [Candidatus Omnitrophota bacterium]